MKPGSIVLVLAVALVAACNRDSGATPNDVSAPHVKSPPPIKRGPSPEELTAGMVEAVTVGKSGVAVNVKFDLPERPVVGQPVDVVIAVMPQVAADHAILTVSPSDQLPVAAGGGEPIDMPSVEPDQVYRHNVRITPAAEGVQLLGLSITLKHDDVIETRVFSVPVIVGPAGDPPATARK